MNRFSSMFPRLSFHLLLWSALACVLSWAQSQEIVSEANAVSPSKTSSSATSSSEQKSANPPIDPQQGVTKAKPEDAPVMAQGLGTFGQLLPLGRKNLDVQIPSFRDGVPASVVKANSMTRVDETTMSMEAMDIWLYGDHRDEDMRVQIPLADYNMDSKVLISDERSRISRNDFQLEGDHLIFDTVTQQGKLTGRVQMVIFNAGSMTPGPQNPASEEHTKKNHSEGGAPSDSTKTTPPSPNAASATPAANGTPQASSNDQK